MFSRYFGGRCGRFKRKLRFNHKDQRANITIGFHAISGIEMCGKTATNTSPIRNHSYNARIHKETYKINYIHMRISYEFVCVVCATYRICTMRAFVFLLFYFRAFRCNCLIRCMWRHNDFYIVGIEMKRTLFLY